MSKSEFWKLLQDPDFKIWNFGIENRNAEAIALEKSVGAFDLTVYINNEPVNNLQECNIKLVDIDEDVGLRITLVFHVPNNEINVRLVKYVFDIELTMQRPSKSTLIEKVTLRGNTPF